MAESPLAILKTELFQLIVGGSQDLFKSKTVSGVQLWLEIISMKPWNHKSLILIQIIRQYKLIWELWALTYLQVDPLLGPFIDSRQVSARLKVKPGTYVIVPCTYGPDEEGDFLLRVLAEVPAPIKRLQWNTFISCHLSLIQELNCEDGKCENIGLEK